MDTSIPAVCLQCGMPVAQAAARYCPPCHAALRQAGAFVPRLLPVLPVYGCAGTGPLAGRCGRKVAQPAALCPRCESSQWHTEHPVPVPWQPGEAA